MSSCGDPASALLGLGDPLAYRHALQLFLVSQVGVGPDVIVHITRIGRHSMW